MARYLTARNVRVVEVNRPNRQNRRRRGKSDTVDAEAAARAVLSGEATVTPKSGDGPVEALRQLRVARSGAIKARTAAANQIHCLIDTAPDAFREQLIGLTLRKKIAVIERWRPGTTHTPEVAAKRALGQRRASLACPRRRDPRPRPSPQCDPRTIAAPLLARHGVGYETAGQLLVTAGDNPDRMHNEASFAALCGTSPVNASSGKTNRHRLNRGGDRHANSALWTIVLTRMSNHPPTRAYVERRTTEGLSKREIIRCLKRYVAREVFPLVRNIVNEHDTATRRLTSRGALTYALLVARDVLQRAASVRVGEEGCDSNTDEGVGLESEPVVLAELDDVGDH